MQRVHFRPLKQLWSIGVGVGSQDLWECPVVSWNWMLGVGPAWIGLAPEHAADAWSNWDPGELETLQALCCVDWGLPEQLAWRCGNAVCVSSGLFGKLEKRPETDGVLWWALIFTGTNLAVLLTCTSHLIPHCWQTSPLYTGSPWSLGFSVRFWPFQSSSCSDALKCPLIPAQKQLCRGLHIPGRFSSNTEVIAGCAITHYFPPCPHVAQCCGICPAWAENVEHATTGKNESAVRQSLARAEACSASLKSPIQRSESLLGPSGAGSNRL